MDQVGFSASRDRLYVLGDLVNRGPGVPLKSSGALKN
jgi:hypothetical protein